MTRPSPPVRGALSTARGPVWGFLVWVAVCGAGLAPATLAEGPPVDLEPTLGWYEIGVSRRILAVPSAQGGLYLADFDAFVSGRIAPDDEGQWLLDGSSDKSLSGIRFTPGNGREGPALSWQSGNGEVRDATRLPEYGYNVAGISFSNAELALAGTVYEPLSGGPHPAAVFIHGSGASDRDNLWYQAIVHHLVSDGIAVLLPDKRGTGQSEGDWTIASFSDFAADALAGVEALAERTRIGADRIGLVGISQGGWIAPLAAHLSERVAFVVNVSGSTVTPNRQLVHELGGGAFGKLRAAVAKRRRPVWWRKNGEFDPIPYWRSLRVPGFIVFGEEDETDNVPVRLSVQLIGANVPQDVDLTIHVLPESGHALMDRSTGRIHRDFLEPLAAWIWRAVSGHDSATRGRS